MEREQILPHRRSSSYFPAGGCVLSPSCFPGHEEIMGYSRIPYLCNSQSGANDEDNNKKRSKRWRVFLRRLVRDGKISIYGSKAPSFHYDAVSYSQNFDEGCHLYEASIRPYCCHGNVSRGKTEFA